MQTTGIKAMILPWAGSGCRFGCSDVAPPAFLMMSSRGRMAMPVADGIRKGPPLLLLAAPRLRTRLGILRTAANLDNCNQRNQLTHARFTK